MLWVLYQNNGSAHYFYFSTAGFSYELGAQKPFFDLHEAKYTFFLLFLFKTPKSTISFL